MTKIPLFSSLRRGFTLVELLIVVAVIGVLAGGIISMINPVAQFQKAQDSKRKSDLSQIEKALETFYQDNGKYPDAVDNKIKRLDGTTADWGEQWLPYIGTLPKDPSSPSKNYVYYSSGGQTYYLYASLDRGASDPQACTGTNNVCSGPSGGGITMETACGGICNYGVSTPNVSP